MYFLYLNFVEAVRDRQFLYLVFVEGGRDIFLYLDVVEGGRDMYFLYLDFVEPAEQTGIFCILILIDVIRDRYFCILFL